eukprot:TRINITY_DN22982_c0_g1_i1.p1 TRINITY_DN22982_c0_g1~~TRINITY_DN22982_c0_g1_i1.p1  ORF type:complete len:868 (-),score=182.50 TRINITY_DN22982_c0_g1_i1:165-2768(-)
MLPDLHSPKGGGPWTSRSADRPQLGVFTLDRVSPGSYRSDNDDRNVPWVKSGPFEAVRHWDVSCDILSRNVPQLPPPIKRLADTRELISPRRTKKQLGPLKVNGKHVYVSSPRNTCDDGSKITQLKTCPSEHVVAPPAVDGEKDVPGQTEEQQSDTDSPGASRHRRSTGVFGGKKCPIDYSRRKSQHVGFAADSNVPLFGQTLGAHHRARRSIRSGSIAGHEPIPRELHLASTAKRASGVGGGVRATEAEAFSPAPQDSAVISKSSSTPEEASEEIVVQRSLPPEGIRRTPFRNPLKERMKRLEDTTKKKLTLAKQMQEQDLQRRQLDTLPEAEALQMKEVFDRFDLNNSERLEGSEIVQALRELGLQGTTTAEKRDITKLWQEAAKEAAEDARKGGSKRPVIVSHQRDETFSIDFLTFALKVVPCVRQAMTQFRATETMRHFHSCDKDRKGKIPMASCLEVSRTMGMDQRIMEQEFLSRFSSTDSCTLEEFQGMVIRCREQLLRIVNKRERDLQDQMNIDEKTFQECRQDIVNLYDIFVRHAEEDGNLPRDRVMPVLREFGLQPKSFEEREALHSIFKPVEDEEEDDLGCDTFSFMDFLELAQALRSYHMEKNAPEQLAMFERYDRDRSGQLSVPEISHLLVDVGCAPLRRKEQEELAQLIQIVDADGNGSIDFQEFQVLSQRIDEKLRSMRYGEEIEHAMTLGFTESQLRDLRWVFDSLDADGSEKLSAVEVRIGLGQMDMKVSQHSFESAFTMLDTDKNGELDFLEFLDFMQLMRDGEGLFSEDSQKLASRPKYLEASLLRRILENFRLTKSYLNSLSKDELVDTFCHLFELDPACNMCVELNITSVGELFKVARKRGALVKAD